MELWKATTMSLVTGASFQVPAYLNPIKAWHHDIEEDNVGFFGEHLFVDLKPGVNRNHGEAGALESILGHGQDKLIVVGHENFHCHSFTS